jgi:REP element-mobilizing transposase RayT
LDVFIVMPNHVHGIVIIVNNGRGTARRAPTMEQFGKPVANLFKPAVTKRINEIRATTGTPVWQRNYYEHIIRKEESLNRIREYTLTNPLRWHLDKENPCREGEDEFDRWFKSQFKGG